MDWIKDKEEFNQIADQLKKKIQHHINNNEIREAGVILDSIDSYLPHDPDIYSFKGILKLIEGDLSKAQAFFKQGIVIQGDNTDLLYNLGHVNELLENYTDAYHYYRRAKDTSLDELLIEELEHKLNTLSSNHTISEETVSLKKKVLVIAHIFPPIGGSGVQRTLKFVKYLKLFNWEPIVVTAGDTRYPLIDKTLLSEVPEDLMIFRVDEPASINQNDMNELLNVYHSIVNKKEIVNEFISEFNKASEKKQLLAPDNYIIWAIHTLEAIRSKVDMTNIDMIYTTSGPYSDHIIGYMLNKEFNKPWVADFRDEWTNNPYSRYDTNSIQYKMAYAMEWSIVHTADQVITTTPLATDNYIQLFQLDQNKVKTITNGYDEADFEGVDQFSSNPDIFSIFHNGLLYSIRTPVTFLQAVKNLIDRGDVKKEHLHIGFTWTENDDAWINFVEGLGLQNQVEFYGYLSHKESLIQAKKASALLLIVGPGEKNKALYPGKIFEYLRLNKPIISLSPSGSVVENLLLETERGINADFDDVASIEKMIYTLYTEWMNRNLPVLNSNQSNKISQFERKELTRNLTSVFDHILEENEKNSQKKKIAFLSIKDGDKFINDTIQGLTEEYHTRKFIITDLSQIEPAMRWADIVWFEWCDSLIEYASKLAIASEKHIICRLHRYEVFTEHPKNVLWENVDKLIVVTDHLKQILVSYVPDLEERVEIVTIHNGVNIDQYKFKERDKGFNLAFVGYMIPRKNPMMLLQIAKQLVQIDERYKIYIAGDFQDEMLRLYWDYQVKELQLQNNVFFQGFQINMSQWLDDKDYIISTTMHESFGYGIAEAMARGIKPVIHNFLFSKEIWPEKYLYNTIDEAVAQITSDDYSSADYRQFIEANYSLVKQLNSTKELLTSLSKQNKKDHIYSYNGVKLSYFKENFENFIPYDSNFVNNYDFTSSRITIGKRERITRDLDLFEFIIENSSGAKLILFNIWYNHSTQEFFLPNYLQNSNKKENIIYLLNYILQFNLSYPNNIGGYILDPILQEDVKKNALVYGWERGIPATQFMSSIGYLRIIERYKKAAQYISDGDIVLDAASGFGYGSAFFSRMAKKVIAIDLAQDNITFGQSAYPFSNIQWKEGDVTNLPVDSSSIDVYVSFETVEHLPLDILDSYFQEALRVLKPGGKMILSTPNAVNRRHINNPYHIKEYTHQEFNELLQKYFNKIDYFSSENYMILDNVTGKSTNMMAVCIKN